MYNIYFNKNSVLAQLKLFRVNSISTIVNVSIFLYYWFKFYRYDDVCLIMITFMEFQLDQEAISALGGQLNYSAICGKKYQLTFINTQFLSLLLLFFFLGLLSLLMKFYIIQKKNTLQRKSLVSESSKRQFKDRPPWRQQLLLLQARTEAFSLYFICLFSPLYSRVQNE